jgi:hypothetical protein
MNLLIFRHPEGFRPGSLPSRDSPAACRHGIHREPAGAGFDSSSKGKDKTVTGYDVKGIS